MSLVVALVVAMVWSVFAFPMKSYQCWLSWSRWPAVLGLLCYVVLAGGGAGLLGWTTAYLAKAAPTPIPALNGLFYGFAGALASRADLGMRAKRGSNEAMNDAKAGLAVAIKWLGDAMDRVAQREASKWLKGLSPTQLADEAVRVTGELFNLPASEMSSAAKEGHEKLLRPRLAAISRSNSSERTVRDACSALRSSLAPTYVASHIAKPV